MYLHRLHLDTACTNTRRDLADPYQMHATLCRGFSTPSRRCDTGEFLWRLEPEGMHERHPRLLVQSRRLPDWSRIEVHGWMTHADPPLPLDERLHLDSLSSGDAFRFRLRGNPSTTRAGKRQGCLRQDDQQAWLLRKGIQHGFHLSQPAIACDSSEKHTTVDVQISQAIMLRGRQHAGNVVRVFSVLFDGILRVTDPSLFIDALRTGIGHGKCFGLGLLSVAPLRKP